MLSQLIEIGFIKVGHWSLLNDELELTLESEVHYFQHVLYSFVVNDEPKYIGKTTQQICKRMYGYRKPAISQSTNIRNNKNIKAGLKAGDNIDLYVLPDHGLLHFGVFNLNLAAGLEDSIIFKLSPEWNIVGK